MLPPSGEAHTITSGHWRK